MAIIVQKYGGSSVESIGKIKGIAEQIAKRKKDGNEIVVVVSAMGKTTDNLVHMAYDITVDPHKRELDVLLASGEQVSMSLLSIALNSLGIEAVSYTGQQLGIKTEGSHTKSRILDINDEKIRKDHDNGKVVIVAGFQGVNENNDITTLGRGGSDTTAVALAAKLHAQCEIYTDVDGIYTIDPRLYPRARKLDVISYEEMLEMASSGATVMHPRSIELAEKYKVPVLLALNTGDIPGSLIKEIGNTMENSAITGLAVNNDQAIITLNGVPHNIKVVADIFQNIANKDINIDMISQTFPVNRLVSISFTLPKADLRQALKVLDTFKDKIFTLSYEAFENISKLSVVGLGMNTQSGVAAKVFTLLAENDIPVSIVTTSEIKISYIINPEDQHKAIEAIAKEFDL